VRGTPLLMWARSREIIGKLQLLKRTLTFLYSVLLVTHVDIPL
jgi:hypothetical protein